MLLRQNKKDLAKPSDLPKRFNLNNKDHEALKNLHEDVLFNTNYNGNIKLGNSELLLTSKNSTYYLSKEEND